MEHTPLGYPWIYSLGHTLLAYTSEYTPFGFNPLEILFMTYSLGKFPWKLPRSILSWIYPLGNIIVTYSLWLLPRGKTNIYSLGIFFLLSPKSYWLKHNPMGNIWTYSLGHTPLAYTSGYTPFGFNPLEILFMTYSLGKSPWNYRSILSWIYPLSNIIATYSLWLLPRGKTNFYSF